DDLALALVAPLGADHRHVRHLKSAVVRTPALCAQGGRLAVEPMEGNIGLGEERSQSSEMPPSPRIAGPPSRRAAPREPSSGARPGRTRQPRSRDSLAPSVAGPNGR